MITELRFSLNDANTAADGLEAEKRQLRSKNEQLERRIRESDQEAATLRQEIQKHKDACQIASEDQEKLKLDISTAREKSIETQEALQAAQQEIKETKLLLDGSRKELQGATASAIERERNVTEKSLPIEPIQVIRRMRR